MLKEVREERILIYICQQLSDEPVLYAVSNSHLFSPVCQYNHRKLTSHGALTCNCTLKVNLSSSSMSGVHLNHLFFKPPICIFLCAHETYVYIQVNMYTCVLLHEEATGQSLVSLLVTLHLIF